MRAVNGDLLKNSAELTSSSAVKSASGTGRPKETAAHEAVFVPKSASIRTQIFHTVYLSVWY